ncbi:unnamed protein product [Paramecium sonneborni]|uniref:Serine aminopeptidase S33 domain-containing protein n=1 Tax=Paramecium sonneborni TaxID=65129 RepID=A0A8S1KCZ5_9CILI|nr:unnamed protein product [Paramecium sonneborni]
MQITDVQKKIMAILGIVISILGILYLIDWLIIMQFGCLGHFIFFVGLYVFIKNTIRLFVFPGSYWLWRRNVENRYAKALAKRANKRMEGLQNLIRKLLMIPETKEVNAEDLLPFKKTLQSFLNIFSSLNYRKELNEQQKHLFGLFQLIEQNLKDIQIESNSLYGHLDNPQEIINNCKQNIKVDTEQCSNLLIILDNLIDQLQEIYMPKNIFLEAERWIFNRTLGTVDQMRVELENTFKTKRFKVQGYDGKLIDCFYIFANEDDPENNDRTVIFCQPNAGYYEYMYYESEWIDYYLKRGINMFLWNYRGYCESQGLPNTKDIMKDAEVICDYVTSQLKVNQLIFHGESLGGMVACHLGRVRQCNLLFADRTFSSISKIAQVGFSKYASFLFKLLTSWDYNSAKSYVECQSYKILAVDQKDEVIPFLSSLKVDVTKEIFIKEFGGSIQNDENFKQSDQKYTFCQRILKFIPWIPKSESTTFFDIWYSQLLNKQEMLTFFEANKRIQYIMKDLQTERNKKTLDDSYSTYINESQEIEKQFSQNQNSTLDIDEGMSQLKGPYTLSEKDKLNENLLKFVNKVYECFESFETASMTLNDVFSSFNESQQYEIFLDYLLSIFFWGSYLPLKNISKKKMNTVVCQKLAFARFTSNINKIETLIKNEKNNLDSPNGTRLIQDLEIIIQRLKLIRENFKKTMRNQHQHPSHQSIQIDVKESEERKPTSKINESLKIQLGSFIPLGCGHNGNLNQTEVEVLDFHMSQAGIVKY